MMAHYETNRQVIYLSKAKRCLDQANHLSRYRSPAADGHVSLPCESLFPSGGVGS
jgi:hypothetical protein